MTGYVLQKYVGLSLLGAGQGGPIAFPMTISASGGSSYRRGGGLSATRRPTAEHLAPPWMKISNCTNHCHRDPANVFFTKMRNSLFKLLILFDVFDKYQLIY